MSDNNGWLDRLLPSGVPVTLRGPSPRGLSIEAAMSGMLTLNLYDALAAGLRRYGLL